MRAPALSSPRDSPHIRAMAKSPDKPKKPKDPARPTRAKAARPDAPATPDALADLLNPGINKGTAGLGSGTGLQPPPDNSWDRAPDFSAAHKARKSARRRASGGAAERLHRLAGDRARSGAGAGTGARRRRAARPPRNPPSEAERIAPEAIRNTACRAPTCRSRARAVVDGRRRHRRGAGKSAARGPAGIQRAAVDAAPAAAPGKIRRRHSASRSSPSSSRRATSRRRSRNWSKASSATTARKFCWASPARARPSPWPR